MSNRDKFLNQIRFSIFYFVTSATGLFEITCRGATSFAELDQDRKLVTTVGSKQTTQYLVSELRQSIDVLTSGVKYF